MQHLTGADLDRVDNPASIFKSIRLQGFRHKSGIGVGVEPCHRFKNYYRVLKQAWHASFVVVN